jgi:hypothetical protein
VTPARRLLEDRVAKLSDDLDALFTESRERARREHAEQLNQAVRRLKVAGDPDELCATLENAADQFSEGALLFRIEDGVARHERIAVPLETAPAFAAAVESREPQTAATIATQIGPELIDLLAPAPTNRASIFPIEVEERVTALVYCWGTTQSAAVELLAQFAGMMWREPEPEPGPEPELEMAAAEPAPDLVTIAPAPASEPAPKPTWESLPALEQQIHLRAQRFARVQTAEMRLFEADAVQSGRSRHDIYGAVRERIDAARKSFHEQFFSTCPSMVDYLHLELVRTLANDDTDLLGKDYPGPLV